jgi:hypothetical protein
MLLGSEGGKHSNRHSFEAPERIGNRGGGGSIQPLGVIDRQHDGRVCGQVAHERQQRGCDDARIERGVGALAANQRDVERSALHRREVPELALIHLLEQVGKPGERQPSLRTARPGAKHATALTRRVLDPSTPERRLPDPGRPGEHEQLEPLSQPVPKIPQLLELEAPADDLLLRHAKAPNAVGTRAQGVPSRSDARTHGAPTCGSYGGDQGQSSAPLGAAWGRKCSWIANS